MVYQDVMTGKRCNSASDFAHLIKAKQTAMIVDELTIEDIQGAREKLQCLFDNAKPVPNIQKLYSMSVAGVGTLTCKVYSNSVKQTTVNF